MNSLGFSKTEANGFLLLLILTICLAVLPRIYFKYSSASINTANKSMDTWVQELNNSIQKNEIAVKQSSVPTQFSAFDPNKTPLHEMIKAGVPELIAKRITLYREKGGAFKRPEDIRKIYGLTDEVAKQLIPYVKIPKTEIAHSGTSQRFESSLPKTSTRYSLDLNTTVAEELQLIKGIGPVLSDRIIKYRNRLGGFHSHEQLKEVYGLKPEVIDELLNQSTLSSPVIPFDINNDSLKVLVRHPYVSYDLARIILNYRKVHGNFEHAEDVRNIKILSDSLYQKLYPYLSK